MKGKHCIVDIKFSSKLSHQILGKIIFQIMIDCIQQNTTMKILNQHLSILGESSPSGFAICITLDESHMTCHSYFDEGLLAVDAFTCGNTDTEELISIFISKLQNILFSTEILRNITIGRF